MGNYTGNNVWVDSVYQYDLTDAVIGGPDGTANKPLQNLADRTAYLLNKFGAMEGDVVLTGSATIDESITGKLITINAGGILNFAIADASTFKPGAILPFSVFAQPGCVVNLTTTNPIWTPDGGISTISIHNAEQLFLVAFSDHFKIGHKHGNFDCVGEEVKARIALSYALPFIGQIIQREQFPRLTKFVLTKLKVGQEIVTEDDWQNGGMNYKGCFSLGNGVSTLRLPDERGLFERMLDMGRGVDINRVHNYAGGYEADQNKSHSHGINTTTGNPSPNPLADPIRGTISGSKNTRGQEGGGTIEASGGAEVIVKNIAKINQIKF